MEFKWNITCCFQELWKCDITGSFIQAAINSDDFTYWAETKFGKKNHPLIDVHKSQKESRLLSNNEVC